MFMVAAGGGLLFVVGKLEKRQQRSETPMQPPSARKPENAPVVHFGDLVSKHMKALNMLRPRQR
jgi:hypothetical protein